MSKTIEDWRAEIDAIDSQLLQLLNRRAQIAVEVGHIKKFQDSPLCDPEREREVLRRACRANTGPLDNEAVENIFRCIIKESKRAESRVF